MRFLGVLMIKQKMCGREVGASDHGTQYLEVVSLDTSMMKHI